jgi:hypothetical protein
LARNLRVGVLAASFQARGEDKDLASVVWETALAAFQAVAAEPPRASPAEFVEGLNRTLKIGTGMATVSITGFCSSGDERRCLH